MNYNAKELWNSKNETNKLIKAAFLYSEKQNFADIYFNNYINEDDYDEPIEELFDELKLDYEAECIQNLKCSKYWNPNMWEEDEETWKGTEEDYDKLLENIEFLR